VAAHLILKHASASRPAGEWNDDDFQRGLPMALLWAAPSRPMRPPAVQPDDAPARRFARRGQDLSHDARRETRHD
jgi:hypothetical protein